MDIAGLRERITVEVATTTIDEIGNHEDNWAAAFSCWATVSDSGGSEAEAAGQTVDRSKVTFTIRYSKAAEAIEKKTYRIEHRGKHYNIEDIDHLSYRKNAIKIIGSLESEASDGQD